MRALCLGLLVALVGWRGAEAGRPMPVDSRTELGRVHLALPAGDTTAVLFLYSDADGWTGTLDDAAARLAGEGMIVVGIDLRGYLSALDSGNERDCHYLVSAIEELSKRLQREQGARTYRAPLLAGVGAGGTLAYAALAQAPAATVAGAVSVDPSPTLATRLPICAGAPFTSTPDGFAYGRRDALPGWWRVVSRATPNPYPFVDELALGAQVELGAGSGLDAAILTTIAALTPPSHAPDEASTADLPIVPLPPQGPPAGLLALILSGDGGWRDLDKQIGEWLSARGVGVVGIDSLRYFWTEKPPAQIARDIERILAVYMPRFAAARVILVGYSFGADVLPATWRALSPAARAQVVQVSLLGLGPSADFEFHVSGWLGLSRGSRAVAEDAAALDPHLVQCFYGEEEADTFCRDPILATAELIRTRGGHHFDGDYAALARRILDGARRRLGASSG